MVAAALANKSNARPSVEEYYSSLESRLGYFLILGNARHCGLWKPGTLWPLPISRAQRAMEEKLYQRLNLSKGSKVLDARAGSGIVASYLAEKHGLYVTGVDITKVHVNDAQKVIQSRGLQEQVSVQMGDYHDLSSFNDTTFDGIYTMETFVHADPIKVLSNFHRLLKRNGVLVLHEGDFHWDSELLQEVLRLSHCENTRKEGSYEDMLAQTGFKDISVEDLTANVLPLFRLLRFLGAVPYDIFRFFGLHTRFTNIMAGVEAYRHWGQGRYISVRAVKA